VARAPQTRDELLEAVQAEVAKLPGNNYEFSQPIQLRFNELISGVRSDVAVKLFGDDMEVLNASTANQIAKVLHDSWARTEVKVEQTTGLPMLTINIDRDKSLPLWAERRRHPRMPCPPPSAARRPARCSRVIAVSTSWFDLPENRATQRPGSDRRLPIPLAARQRGGAELRCHSLHPAVRSGQPRAGTWPQPGQPGKRQAPHRGQRQCARARSGLLRCRSRGRSCSRSRSRRATGPSGAGQFENLQSATQRLQIVVPVSLLLVFVLLFAMFGNVKDGLLVFTGHPLRADRAASSRCGCATSRCRSRRRWVSSRCPALRCSTAW
jgi:cobalt-zinc-cadmium resistance protein CzcA